MKKNNYLLGICALALALLIPQTVWASETSARAVEITQTLTAYKVSPDWPPDLKSNTKLLDELKLLVEGFNQYDVTALGAEKDTVFNYYTKYCEAIGAQVKQIPDAAKAEDMPSREAAAGILQTLVRGQVNPEVQGDIIANAADIEKMLTLVFDYTPEECAATPETERQSIKAYFTGFYSYKGWDTSELDLLFSASDYPVQSKAPAPEANKTPFVPYKNDISPIQDQKQLVDGKQGLHENEILTGLLAVALWLALLTGTVVVLKQRNEKHHGV